MAGLYFILLRRFDNVGKAVRDLRQGKNQLLNCQICNNVNTLVQFSGQTGVEEEDTNQSLN